MPEAPAAAGMKGVVWKVKNEFGRSRAVKLTTAEDYEDRSYLAEVHRAAPLEDYSKFFAHFYDAALTEVTLPSGRHKFVAFVEEWINGITLKDVLEDREEKHAQVSFFMAYVEALAGALNALKSLGLQHDDLHPANVMIAAPPDGLLDPRWAPKIIDTGSLKPLDESCKRKDDHRHFVEHLVGIWNAIKRKRALSALEHRFLSETRALLSSMLDDDPTIALRDPPQVLRQFQHAYMRAQSTTATSDAHLSHPFEFISAEHIADDRLLVDIFANSCPWLDKVSSQDPCLVTGPRGCGKSTIFRWLSLKVQLRRCQDAVDSNLRIAGFYVSCSADLQNRFSWIASETLADRFRSEIIHYFNLLLAREIVSTLGLIEQREDAETFWGLGAPQKRAVCDFILRSIRVERPHLQGVSLLQQLRECIERELFLTHENMLGGLTKTQVTPETFLGDLTALLARQFPIFRSMRICFLVDDFSVHRLPEPVQTVLNRVIWERRGTHVFKLSAEKYGAVLRDPRDATVDPSREMVEIDCGREFIALDDVNARSKARVFAGDLLNHRLASAGYIGTVKELIGPSPRESLADSILKRARGRRQIHYYGIERTADLCSGDASHLLLVYRRIFESADIDKHTTTLASPKIQDQCVRQVSRELLEAVKSHFPLGPEMYQVANAFGQLVRNVLEQGKLIKKGNSFVPSQCPRIEIDQDRGGVVDTLSPTLQQLAKELVRRAIFIDMSPGLSRHRSATTLRWHFRRIYLPAFGAALAKNDAVKGKPDWLKFFLSDPGSACDMVWTKWKRRVPDDGPLFTAAKKPKTTTRHK